MSPFLGAGTEAQAGAWLSGGTQREGGPEPGPLVSTVPLMPHPPVSFLTAPCPPGCWTGRGEPSGEPLTFLKLFTPLPPQKSCTCHPGLPACPAASVHSTPWLSCAPISGRGPTPTPLASRSSPGPPAEGAPTTGSRSNSAGRAEIGREAPFRKPPGLSPSLFPQGFHLA